MHADYAVLVPADWTIAQAMTLLADLSDQAVVVIRGRQDGADTFHVLNAGSVRLGIDGEDPDRAVGEALYLDELPPNRSFDFDFDIDGDIDFDGDGEGPVLRAGDVLLRNNTVVGVAREGGGDRSADGPEPAEPGFELATGGRADLGADRPPGPPRRFRAFADLEAPDAVAVGQTFTVSVGFAARSQTADPDEQPIIVADAPAELTFVVQIAGFGFSYPSGIRRELTVDRDAPVGPTAHFEVVAGDVRDRARRTLEVSFEYGGELCGLAWHEVLVAITPNTGPKTAPAADPPTGRRGGTGVSLGPAGVAPSLTVEIRSEPGSPDLEWIFHTGADIERPSERVVTKLEQPSAEAFAVQLMAALPAGKGAVSLPTTVRGMGKLVNRVIPAEFWSMVEATWRAAPVDEGGTRAVPSLLITTSEPFVPWELAWVDEDGIDPALLPVGVTEGHLGALWRVGRWVPPVPRRRGLDRPAAPPESTVDADALAVVIGDYAADTKIRDLPAAVEEGNAIAAGYHGLPLTVKEGDVDRLMNAALERRGQPFSPTVVHFASHGEVSLAQQHFTGILLSGGRRLDLLTVEGSRLGKASRPFVFLNACQVGTAGSILSTYGGLAGAFLGTGCRGFLAPLWNVDDDVAKQIALDFYQKTLKGSVPVGEAVRQIRAGFGDGSGGTATPLAYVFYGHPDLLLQRPKRPKSSRKAAPEPAGPPKDAAVPPTDKDQP